MKRLLAVTYLQGVFASALTEDMTDYATDEISTILRRNHKLKASDDDDFTIRTQQELSTMLNSTTDLMTTLLACIAGISFTYPSPNVPVKSVCVCLSVHVESIF